MSVVQGILALYARLIRNDIRVCRWKQPHSVSQKGHREASHMNNRIGKVGRRAIEHNKKQGFDLADDIRNGELPENVNIGRIIKLQGFGKCKVFYLNKGTPCIITAAIRGKFGRGGARKAVPTEVGSIVVVADTELKGPGQYQIMSTLTQKHLHEIRKYQKIDSRLLDVTLLDEAAIMSVRTVVEDEGFEFDDDVEETETETKPEKREVKFVHLDDDDLDIDDI